jgi:hypothetical protein
LVKGWQVTKTMAVVGALDIFLFATLCKNGAILNVVGLSYALKGRFDQQELWHKKIGRIFNKYTYQIKYYKGH